MFLASLSDEIKDNLFMFGFGRTLADYNDIGIHSCSDFDFNIIVTNRLIKRQIIFINKLLLDLKKEMWEDYKIEVEINSRFTLLSLDELKKRIDIESENSDKIETIKNLIFYKIISKDFIIFNDNQIIRDYFFLRQKK